MNKLFVILAITSLMLFACQKDKDANTFAADLKIDNLLKLLPDVLRNKRATIAVFYNESGVERRFKLTYTDTTLAAQSQGVAYGVDKKSITYIDLQDKDHRLWIVVSGNYAEKLRIMYLKAGITPISNNPLVPIATVYENDDPRLMNKRATMTILDRVFKEVYVGTSSSQAFSEIGYNQEFGIVGYRGESNGWWAFRRFE